MPHCCPGKRVPDREGSRPCDVAIVGMACLFPKAGDLRTYWENILTKKNAITEIPPERWDWRLYFDENRQATDKIYSKWGGFMDDLYFDPTRYGLPPKSLESIDPDAIDGPRGCPPHACRCRVRRPGVRPGNGIGHSRSKRRGRRCGCAVRTAFRTAEIPRRAAGGDRQAPSGMDGGHLPGNSAQCHIRPDRQPSQPGRRQFRHRRSLRLFTCRGVSGDRRTYRPQKQHGHHRRCGYGAETFRVHLLQQDPGLIARGAAARPSMQPPTASSYPKGSPWSH